MRRSVSLGLAIVTLLVQLSAACETDQDCDIGECCNRNLIRSRSCKKIGRNVGDACGGRECGCTASLQCTPYGSSVWNRFRASEGTCQVGVVPVEVPDEVSNGRSVWDQPTSRPVEEDEEWRERILELLDNHSFLRDEDEANTANQPARGRQ